MGKKIFIAAAAVAVVGAGASLILNSRHLKMRRMFKRASRAMYVAGTMLRTLSCQVTE